MSKTEKNESVHRRSFLIAAGAGGAAMAAINLSPGVALADKAAVAKEIQKVTGGKKTVSGKIGIDAPEIAENGNTVPISISVSSKMNKGDMVKSVHLFAEGNPNPLVASFWFSDQSGAAKASFRMRMAKTQNIVAVAEMADGSFYMDKRLVKVTIGGCGG